MSNSGNKFFVVTCFSVLIISSFLSMWFFFVMTFVRKQDIHQYKIDNEMIISNLYRATQKFMYDIVTNKPLQVAPSFSSDFRPPRIISEVWGYADYFGKDIAIYPDGLYLYEGDYHKEGLITAIDERSIYCLSPSNTVVIIRRSSPRESPAKQVFRPVAEKHEDAPPAI